MLVWKDKCLRCNHRDTCKKPCKEVEEYINRATSLESGTVYNINYWDTLEDTGVSIWDYSDNKSKYELIFELYFLDHRSLDEINYHISYGRRHIARIIRMFKDNVKPYKGNKGKILRLLFVERESLSDIRQKVNVSNSYILKVIKDYVNSNKPT